MITSETGTPKSGFSCATVGAVIWMLAAFYITSAEAQGGASVKAKMHDHAHCISRLPQNWGPNFGPEWRENEAKYWACRLAVPFKVTQSWQSNIDSDGAIQDIQLTHFRKSQAAVVAESSGSAHCYSFFLLQQSSGGEWRLASKLEASDKEPMRFCTLSCPAIKMTVTESTISLRLPSPSDPNEDASRTCTKPVWASKSYRWDGKMLGEIPAISKEINGHDRSCKKE